MYADIYIYGTTPVAYNSGKEVWLTEYYIVHEMQIYAKVSCTANPTPGKVNDCSYQPKQLGHQASIQKLLQG